MTLRYFVAVLSGCLACAEMALADVHVPAAPDTPEKFGLMTPAEKSELEACVARAAQSAGDGNERRAMVGVFIGANGRPMSLAILESSGLEDLDKLVLRCLSRVSYTPAAPDKQPIQWIFKTVLRPKRATPDAQ